MLQRLGPPHDPPGTCYFLPIYTLNNRLLQENVHVMPASFDLQLHLLRVATAGGETKPLAVLSVYLPG